MTSLHHRIDGPGDGPVLVLGPSLGSTLDLWEPQLPAFTASWQVVRFDLPGHGGSGPCDGTVEDIADAVAALLDRLGVARVAYAGVSMGGAVGMALALRHPDRIGRLALCCTSARFGDPSGWHERARRVRAGGLEPFFETLLGRWFTPGYTGPGIEAVRAMLATVEAAGYAACCEALAAFDVRDRLGAVRAPTLVVAGEQDVATPPAHAQELARGIPGAKLTLVPGAAHLANLERPERVTDAIAGHLAGPAGP